MPTNAMATLLVIAMAAMGAPRGTNHMRLVAIVSPSLSVTNLSVADLRRIYVADMTRWPDGHRIVPVLLSPKSASTEMFLRHIIRMSDIDYAQQWIGAVFRGRVAAPPFVFSTASDAVRFVATHNDAIAVLPDQPNIQHQQVHILTIDRFSIDDVKYPLAW